MRRTLASAGTLLLLLPSLASARTLTIGNFATPAQRTVTERPSRRSIRAAVRQAPDLRNPRMISITEVPLDATYAAVDLGVKIQYPSRWTRDDLRQVTPPLTLAVMFLSRERAPAGIRQNINLVVEELPAAMTLKEYTDRGIAVERDYFEHYALLRSEDVTIAGIYRAHRVIFTATLPGGDMTFEQIWMLRGTTAHVWTFADAAGVFNEHVKTFERMMDTLTVQ